MTTKFLSFPVSSCVHVARPITLEVDTKVANALLSSKLASQGPASLQGRRQRFVSVRLASSKVNAKIAGPSGRRDHDVALAGKVDASALTSSPEGCRGSPAEQKRFEGPPLRP